MPRRPRVDRPGRLHHVMNRGIARRTVFESPSDKRVFLALLARAVRERRIELHAFALLSTHFHLLVRSLDGNLSETLRRVQNVYVRWFNRTRRRDGPLFRGRFRSVPVDSPGHVRTLVRYIDDNAVEAGLAPAAAAYDFGRAVHYVAGLPRPRWLHRDRVGGPLVPLLEGERAACRGLCARAAPCGAPRGRPDVPAGHFRRACARSSLACRLRSPARRDPCERRD